MKHRRILIVGIGSSHGDDQFGWRVVEQLAVKIAEDCDSPRCEVTRLAKSPVDMLDWLDGLDSADRFERLIVVDACRGSGAVGGICRWMWPTEELPVMLRGGSHDFSITKVLKLAATLGKLPGEVIIWSVEAASGGVSELSIGGMSAEVYAAIPEVVERVVGEMGSRVVSSMRHSAESQTGVRSCTSFR